MWNWAGEREIIPTNPFQGVKAPGKEIERERVLADEELVRAWSAADEIGGVAGGFVKMLILTGQRRDEVAGMRWNDLDPDLRVWTIPKEETKGDRTHEVPLSPLAVEVLTALPRWMSGLVFSTTGGEKPISGYSKMEACVDRKSASSLILSRLGVFMICAEPPGPAWQALAFRFRRSAAY